MSAVLLAFGAALAVFLAHITAWQVRVPARQMRTLALFFAVGLVVAVVAGWIWLADFGWGETVYVAALYGAMGLCYMVLYTAIECDSPTLSLSYFIDQAGVSGRTPAEITAFIGTRPFVRSRLAQLEADGFVIRNNSTLVLAPKSAFALEAGEVYRRLMGRRSRGG